MYCPQCGTESTSGQQYCRSCGANLKVIGKAVTLSEAIGRSDRGPFPKFKEMMKNFKLDQVTEEVSRAFDQVSKEIVTSSDDPKRIRTRSRYRRRKTAEERRERHIVNGTISLFWGTGLTIFLYYLSAALVLKLPPHVIAQIPFELDPVVKVIWLIGLIPAFSGLGRIIAGLTIRPGRERQELPPHENELEGPEGPRVEQRPESPKLAVASESPASVTEHTTNILEHRIPVRRTSEISEG